ncbi:MAG: toprim domain-containing protein [Nanoarchaeota archaeon]
MDTLHDWVKKLKESNKLIIVEGIKDKKTLNELGIGKVITINKPLFELVEEIASLTNECVLLLDLDSEGRKLYSSLKKNLERNKVKIDNRYREFLFSNTHISNIEGLKNYL